MLAGHKRPVSSARRLILFSNLISTLATQRFYLHSPRTENPTPSAAPIASIASLFSQAPARADQLPEVALASANRRCRQASVASPRQAAANAAHSSSSPQTTYPPIAHDSGSRSYFLAIPNSPVPVYSAARAGRAQLASSATGPRPHRVT